MLRIERHIGDLFNQLVDGHTGWTGTIALGADVIKRTLNHTRGVIMLTQFTHFYGQFVTMTTVDRIKR